MRAHTTYINWKNTEIIKLATKGYGRTAQPLIASLISRSVVLYFSTITPQAPQNPFVLNRKFLSSFSLPLDVSEDRENGKLYVCRRLTSPTSFNTCSDNYRRMEWAKMELAANNTYLHLAENKTSCRLVEYDVLKRHVSKLLVYTRPSKSAKQAFSVEGNTCDNNII